MGETYYPGSPAHGWDGGKWRSIKSAPRDGTIIEIRCTYGVAPWYGLYRWVETPNTFVFDARSGQQERWAGRWAKVGDDNSGFSEGDSFTWRHYEGDVHTYVDPTCGAQDSPEYWRAAVAVKHGLPADYFERQATASPREWLRASLLILLGIFVVLVIGGLIMLAGIALGANPLLAAFIGASCAFWILVRYRRKSDQQ